MRARAPVFARTHFRCKLAPKAIEAVHTLRGVFLLHLRPPTFADQGGTGALAMLRRPRPSLLRVCVHLHVHRPMQTDGCKNNTHWRTFSLTSFRLSSFFNVRLGGRCGNRNSSLHPKTHYWTSATLSSTSLKNTFPLSCVIGRERAGRVGRPAVYMGLHVFRTGSYINRTSLSGTVSSWFTILLAGRKYIKEKEFFEDSVTFF